LKSDSLLNFIFTNKNVIKEGSWVLSGQIINAVINLATLRIITNFLPANVLGEATMWLGITVLLKSIFIQPILNYQIRFYPEYQIENKITDFNAVTLKIILLLFAVSGLLFFIISLVLLDFNIIKADYLLLLIIVSYSFLDIIKSFYINQYTAERRQNRYALWIIFEALIILLITYMVISRYPTTNSYIASMSLGIFLGIIFFRDYPNNKLKYIKKTKLKVSLIFKQATNFSLPFVTIAILSWIMNLSSRYFIGFTDSTYEAGLFVASFSIASRPFIMVSGVATSFFRPILLQATSKNDMSKISLVLKFWLITIVSGGTLLIIMFIFGSNLIANILLAPEYRKNSIILFLLIGLGYFGLAMFQVFENFLFAQKRTKEILYSNIVGTFIFIISSLILVKYFLSIGAAIAVAIAFIFQLLSVIYFFKFSHKTE
jgi:O-antigen/teichoic acid export membrane protein